MCAPVKGGQVLCAPVKGGQVLCTPVKGGQVLCAPMKGGNCKSDGAEVKIAFSSSKLGVTCRLGSD